MGLIKVLFASVIAVAVVAVVFAFDCALWALGGLVLFSLLGLFASTPLLALAAMVGIGSIWLFGAFVGAFCWVLKILFKLIG
jgi:hypothetical protein